MALMFVIMREKRLKLLVSLLIFGMFACVTAGFFNSLFAYLAGYNGLQTALYIAPIVEEILKALPIVVLLFIAKQEPEVLLYIAVGVGVGFATIENIGYLFTYGASDIGFILIRGFATGVMHCLTTLFVALGLYMISSTKVTAIIGLVGVLACASTYHGIFNLLVNGSGIYPIAGYLMPICTSALYVFLLKGPREKIIRFVQKGKKW